MKTAIERVLELESELATLRQQLAALTAEREELREALEKIARMRTEPLPNKMWHLILADAYSIAEAAVDRLKNGEQMESIAIAQSEQPEQPRTCDNCNWTRTGCKVGVGRVECCAWEPRTAGEQAVCIDCEHQHLKNEGTV